MENFQKVLVVLNQITNILLVICLICISPVIIAYCILISMVTKK